MSMELSVRAITYVPRARTYARCVAATIQPDMLACYCSVTVGRTQLL